MHSPIYKDFGERLSEIRKKSGMTQADIAAKLGTVQSTYSGYELGTRKITLELIISLSKILNVPPDYLIMGDKKQSALENTKAEDVKKYEKLGQKLYETCLDAGLIAEGQELTRAESEFLYGLSTMLFSFFDTRNK